MKLNRQTDIAIAALVYGMQAKGRLFCIDAIAKNCGISTASVAQVTRRLTRLGWFKSHRGRGGGLTLAMDAEKLSLAHIVDTLQPARRDRPPHGQLICFSVRPSSHVSPALTVIPSATWPTTGSRSLIGDARGRPWSRRRQR